MPAHRTIRLVQVGAATIAVLFGIATLFAGGRVLLGSDPGYEVFRPLLIYNTSMGVAYLAAGAALLQGGLANAWRGQARAAGEIGALEVARAQLAAAGIETPLTQGVREGVAKGGYRWRVMADPEGNEFCIVPRDED